MILGKPCLSGHQEVELQNKLDTVKSYMYAELHAKSQPLPVTIASSAKKTRNGHGHKGGDTLPEPDEIFSGW
jgi:hypothetical protein